VEPGQTVKVTVKASAIFQPIQTVELRYRVMYGEEAMVPMRDDGLGGDGQARDGIFSAVIPSGQALPGQMLRWYVTARDAQGRASRLPAWEDPLNSQAYVGTLGATNISTALPVFHWFLENRYVNAAATRSGTRCTVFYAGELYDNVQVRLRGENSVTWDKKSYKFDFNPDQRFRYSPSERRVDEINLNSTWSDKTHLRQVLSWEVYRDAGAPGCRSFPLRIHQNGLFHSLAVFVEQPDEVMLERNGLSPRGSLYKINNALESTDGAEKLLPRDAQFEELQDFVDGISAGNPRQALYLFDHLDIPSVVNYLAATVLIHDNDCTAKNYFLYHDLEGSGEWQVLPWDKDLTFGRNFRSRAGLSDEIWADFDHTNSIGSDHPFSSPSHPLFMDQNHQKENGQWNRLTEALYSNPLVRQMYLRRLRSLMDDLLQPNETPLSDRRLERRLDELLHAMEPESLLDRARWGYPTYGTPQTMGMAVQILQSEYLVRRRHHFFVSHSVTNAAVMPDSARIPEPEPPAPVLQFGVIERSPLSGNPEEQFVEVLNPNPYSVDISGWAVQGGVRHLFRPGTVVPSGGLLILTANRRAFRERSLQPRGGMGLLVQGNYQGRLGSGATHVELVDGSRVVARAELADIRTARQRQLVLNRLMYEPAVLNGGRCESDEELEYVELRNRGPEPLDLRGVRFTEGIHFDFADSRIQFLPAPSDASAPSRSLFLVKNRARFVAHYGLEDRIAGEYVGSLDNQGERLRLEEPNGEPLLDFRYQPAAQPLTRGLGFGLAWSAALTGSFQLVGGPEGSWILGPWEAIPGPVPPLSTAPSPPSVLINEIIAAPEEGRPDTIELIGAEHTEIGGWFLSDEFRFPMKYRLPFGTRIPSGGFFVIDATSFGVASGGFPGFGLAREGESVHLFSASPEGRLTGYHHGAHFPAQALGASYGRFEPSDASVGERWASSGVPSLGTTNAPPRPGPVVFSEIMYHAPDASDGSQLTELSFIGLHNTSGQRVLAFDPLMPTNTWSIAGSIEYRFPRQFVFPPAGEVLLVGFDPVSQVDQTEAFRRFHGVPTTVRMLGPWKGNLDAKGGCLVMKSVAVVGEASRLDFIQDEACYMAAPPWDALADGQGPSLSRIDPLALGTEPGNWVATAPNPGQHYDPALHPSILIHPADRVVDGYSDATLGVLAGPDPTLRYQWRRNGKPLPGAVGSILRLPQVPPRDSGRYDVVVMARGGVLVSEAARLEVLQPPIVYSHPAPPLIPVLGSNYVLSVGVMRQAAPVTYQWFFNRQPLLGEVGSELRLSRLSWEMAGSYSVIVSDGRARVESRPAVIQPLMPPLVIQSPESQMVNVGETIVLRARAIGAEPMVYFWRKNGVYLKGEYRPDLIIPSASLTNAGVYSVVVSNITTPRLIPPLERANVLVLGDTDGDGMPDIWELTYQFRFDQPGDALEDADGDGLNNLQEYLAGTHPRDPSDFVRLDRFDRSSLPSMGMLSFNSISNRAYVVQVADQIGSPWSNWMRFPSLTTNSRVNVVVPFLEAPQRHFRLLVPKVGDPLE
jgi:hypothetical protein